jgi:chemotaxis protein MotB
MRRKHQEEVKAGAPEWMNTYGDMVTLLLTFFVMLFAMSTIEEQKFSALSQSLQTALGDIKGSVGINYGGNSATDGDMIGKGDQDNPALEEIIAALDSLKSAQMEGNIAQDSDDMERVYIKVKQYVQSNDLGEVVEIVEESRGILIRFKDSVLFDSGKAIIIENAKVILNNIAKILSEVDKNIRVEGHTDNRPINTPQFPSNWELSTQRAVNVLKYFIEVNGLAPVRLSAVGYGEYHPVDDNVTAEGRQKNRRVDIVILREYSGKDSISQ